MLIWIYHRLLAHGLVRINTTLNNRTSNSSNFKALQRQTQINVPLLQVVMNRPPDPRAKSNRLR